jgi:ABC-2 type transport system ATP-binding protein
MRVAGEDAVRVEGDRLLLDLEPGAAPRLTRALVEGGVDVHEVRGIERTLEEVFFEMTREEREEMETAS